MGTALDDGHFKPEDQVAGKRSIASCHYPLIGPYDSSDPAVLEGQVLQMKFTGLDGVIIDWYGKDDVYDYAINHRNTERIIEAITRAGLKFAICWEDHTIPNLVKFGQVRASGEVAYANSLMKWVQAKWFSMPNYVRVNQQPVWLIFGPQYFKAGDWSAILAGVNAATFGVMGDHQFATGGFARPVPQHGEGASDTALASFYDQAKTWKGFVAGAYPRLNEIYGEAGVSASHPQFGDRQGSTFRNTLKMALRSKSPIVQIATWNDWGEGTVIEPPPESLVTGTSRCCRRPAPGRRKRSFRPTFASRIGSSTSDKDGGTPHFWTKCVAHR